MTFAEVVAVVALLVAVWALMRTSNIDPMRVKLDDYAVRTWGISDELFVKHRMLDARLRALEEFAAVDRAWLKEHDAQLPVGVIRTTSGERPEVRNIEGAKP